MPRFAFFLKRLRSRSVVRMALSVNQVSAIWPLLVAGASDLDAPLISAAMCKAPI